MLYIIPLSVVMLCPIETVESRLRSLIEHRSKIGNVELVIKSDTKSSPLEGKVSVIRNIHVWQSGDKNRTDQDELFGANLQSHLRKIWCMHGESQNMMFSYVEPYARSERLKANLYRFVKSDLIKHQAVLIDPRKLALYPTISTLFYEVPSLEEVFLHGNRKDEKVTYSKFEGHHMVRLSFKCGSATWELWTDNKLPHICYHSAVSIPSTNSKDDGVVCSISSKFTTPSSIETGIPSEYIARRYRQSDRYKDGTETATIELVSINKPIDPKLFTIAGMDLPVSTLVSGDGLPNGPAVWNGRELESDGVVEDKKKTGTKKRVDREKVASDPGALKFNLKIAIAIAGVAVMCMLAWSIVDSRRLAASQTRGKA